MIAPHSSNLLADMAEAHRLSGFSGAEVFRATRDGRQWFVRKAAADAGASPRLRQQAEKQLAFESAVGHLLHTPKILDQGEIQGRFYFDMEFVRGPDAVTYLRQATYPQVKAFADRLCDYLSAAAQQAPLTTSANPSLFDALFGKLCEVQRKTERIRPEHLSRLFLALERVRGLDHLTPTLCHGDLTLQNLLVDDQGEIWALDFLDAPYEHYWQDIAKLHQDVTGGWYLLHQKAISQCVLDYLRERLLQTAEQLHPAYQSVHALLMACAFVRILPYAQTTEQISFVTERIDYFAGRTQL